MPTRHETRFVPHPARQMFALVADVESYPEFLPWNTAARIRSRRPLDRGELIDADLVISFKVFRERFGSRVRLLPDESRILIDYIDGPFRHMHSSWHFIERPGGCDVEFSVDFEFRNRLLQRIIGVVFNEAMARIVGAFERRANQLHDASRP